MSTAHQRLERLMGHVAPLSTAHTLKVSSVAASLTTTDREMIAKLQAAASQQGLDIKGGVIRRTSSRFCLGVEHGDYNGTELFGVGTDRFIWVAYKPNNTNTIRISSLNFPNDGIVSFRVGGSNIPGPVSAELKKYTWAQFPFGVDYVMHKGGYTQTKGYDAVLIGNIPGGGMSRSASLCINLILTGLEVNGLRLKNEFEIIELSQAVENVYTGSPCGQLDQIMIYYAKAGMGTHFNPADKSIKYVPLGNAPDFRIVALDTGTTRHGLESSTYSIRARECKEFSAELVAKGLVNKGFADVQSQALYDRIVKIYAKTKWAPHLDRLTYIYKAQVRFYQMLNAWKAGDIATVGAIFRADGIGLRDEYSISGPELESMCDVVRTVPGVLGERMLGGGDKGAAGAIILAEAEAAVRAAVANGYAASRPAYKDKFKVHAVKVCDGVKTFRGVL